MNIHETTVHARCPYAPTWDYYIVTFETSSHLQCERFQEICDIARGITGTQEQVFEMIRKQMRWHGTLKIVGQHGTNGRLVVSEKIQQPPFPGGCQ